MKSLFFYFSVYFILVMFSACSAEKGDQNHSENASSNDPYSFCTSITTENLNIVEVEQPDSGAYDLWKYMYPSSDSKLLDAYLLEDGNIIDSSFGVISLDYERGEDSFSYASTSIRKKSTLLRVNDLWDYERYIDIGDIISSESGRYTVLTESCDDYGNLSQTALFELCGEEVDYRHEFTFVAHHASKKIYGDYEYQDVIEVNYHTTHTKNGSIKRDFDETLFYAKNMGYVGEIDRKCLDEDGINRDDLESCSSDVTYIYLYTQNDINVSNDTDDASLKSEDLTDPILYANADMPYTLDLKMKSGTKVLNWSVTEGVELPEWLHLQPKQPTIEMISGSSGQVDLGHSVAITLDQNGSLYSVSDISSDKIYRLELKTNVKTMVADMDQAVDDPQAIAVDSSGNIFFANDSDDSLYRLNPQSNDIVRLITGTSNLNDKAIVIDSQDLIYFANGKTIRKIDTVAETVTTLFDGEESSSTYSPVGLAIDKNGSIFFSDNENHVVMKIDPESCTMENIAGVYNKAGSMGDGGPANEALLNEPQGIAFDDDGNLYIADKYNNAVRKVDAVTGEISTVVGILGENGQRWEIASGDIATEAHIDWPTDVDVDTDGNIYVADYWNSYIEKAGPVNTILTGSPSQNDIGSYDINLSVTDGATVLPYNFTLIVQ